MKNEGEYRLTKEDAEELNALLLEQDISVPVFAVTEAKVHHQTVYSALNQERLKPKSFKRITGALNRLRDSSTKSKVAG